MKTAIKPILIGILVVFCAMAVRNAWGDELVREGRWQVLDDAGGVVSVHNEVHVAIAAAQEWSRTHDGRKAHIEPPRYRVQVDPPVAVEPESGRVEIERVTDASASDYEIHGPAGYPVLINDPGDYVLRNGVISAPGSDGDWRHGIYATRGSLTIEDHWFYGSTRESPGGRDHLALYCSGCPEVTIRRLMIGRPDDPFAHDFAIKIKSHADEPDRVTRHVVIEDVVVFGGARVLLSAGNDAADAGVPAAESITIRRLLWVDPKGDGGGRLEALRFDGVGEVTIEELVVIDSAGVLTKPRLVVATDSPGIVTGRAYLPVALGDRPLVDGLTDGVLLMDAPPAGARPPITGPEDIPAWLEWAGMGSSTSAAPPLRLLVRPEFALAGDHDAIEYAYPGNLAGLYRPQRVAAEAEHGPVGPMRELIARRDTPEYRDNLRALVESAAANVRVLAWNVEPLPNADWSAEDRAEWMAGHLLLVADARAIDATVEQAAYRVPFGDPVRESRAVYARDAAVGGKLAEEAGLNASYWVRPERLPAEESALAKYLLAYAYYAPLVEALDYASVHGYQQTIYPPDLWAGVEFARAALFDKPLMLWVSPRERGRSDTGWVEVAQLEALMKYAAAHEAAVVWWVNGADMQNVTGPMQERLSIVGGRR